jgi:hypothetical protein
MLLEAKTVQSVIRLAKETAAEGPEPGAGIPDPLRSRLGLFLAGLSHQELVELVAMISVGRGDPGSDRFEFILGNIYMTKEHAIRYLLDKQYLAEYLDKAMIRLGMTPPQ